ncbi:MAG: CBS domain-containing protein [Oscillochloris sp.]|nr:CBS domain-containing protein [Oscillochloris sp.]
MSLEPTQQLWIYLDEGDSQHGRSLAGKVLNALRAAGCPGATVLRGVGGYGSHGVLHSDLIVDIPSHLPLVITCIDRADRIAQVLPTLQEIISEGLIALSPVQVVPLGRRAGGPFPSHLTVADVMTRDVAAVQPQAQVSEIVGLLIDRAVRALPVVDTHSTVIGIITDGDLLARGGTSLPVRLQQLLPLDERAAQVAALRQQPQRAAGIMTPQPITLLSTTPLAQAAAIMAQHNLKRLPVVGEHGQLVGMVSRSDLLKTVAEGLRQRPEEAMALSVGAPCLVSEMMLHDVPTVHPDTPLPETIERLLETAKRRVVVIDDERRVVGIISDGDVLRRARRPVPAGVFARLVSWFGGGGRPEGIEVAAQGRTAASVMSSPVVTLVADAPISEAIRLMMTHKVKRLPVVDRDDRLVGIVGRAAVLSALHE